MVEKEQESQESKYFYQVTTFDGKSYRLPEKVSLDQIESIISSSQYLRIGDEAMILCSSVKEVVKKKSSNPYW